MTIGYIPESLNITIVPGLDKDNDSISVEWTLDDIKIESMGTDIVIRGRTGGPIVLLLYHYGEFRNIEIWTRDGYCIQILCEDDRKCTNPVLFVSTYFVF